MFWKFIILSTATEVLYANISLDCNFPVITRKGKSVPVIVVPDEPKEKLLPAAGSVCVASRAACTAAATVRDIPLYQHVAALRFGEV
jgi:hypothetical protein